METIEQLMERHFGHAEFRPGQREVISALLAGRSAAAVFPTGSGKSLCYQLPALMLPGLTLVVSPLLALMKDQLDRLLTRRIPAARLDSTLDAQETAAVMSALRDRSLKLLYVAPERFANERFRESLRGVAISLFAVDEAHCLSEWGHNFRPDYLKLARYAKRCGAERTLALTATATPQVMRDICAVFEIDETCAVRTGSYRPNLTLLFQASTFEERLPTLLRRLADRPPGPTIVYVTLQRTAEEVAAALARAGLDARAYHAGMDDAARTVVQDWFAASERAIVVATIAFGMGIDKSNIRYVYHFNLPKSLENYAQEIGRAGRDGIPAICEALVCPDDLNALENFAYGDTPERLAIRGLLAELFPLGAAAPGDSHAGLEFDVSLFELADRHDIRQIVVKTLLTYLELDGYLEEGTPFYSEYTFKPLATSQAILDRFDGERRVFLQQVLSVAKRRKVWCQIDLAEAAVRSGSDRDRVVRALDYLGEQQLLELRVTGLRHRFRRLRRPEDLDRLADELHEKMLRRERREIDRLGQFLKLAEHSACQTADLVRHFGEELSQPCGHCSHCLRGDKAAPVVLPPRTLSPIPDSIWQDALRVRDAKPTALATPRCLARFLCGLTSPRLTSQKLTSQALFGALAGVPFPEVLARAAQALRPQPAAPATAGVAMARERTED